MTTIQTNWTRISPKPSNCKLAKSQTSNLYHQIPRIFFFQKRIKKKNTQKRTELTQKTRTTSVEVEGKSASGKEKKKIRETKRYGGRVLLPEREREIEVGSVWWERKESEKIEKQYV